MCAGIAVGRLRLSSPKIAASLLAVGAAVAAGAVGGLPWLLGPDGRPRSRLRAAGTGGRTSRSRRSSHFGADGVTPTTSIWWLAVRSPHTGTPADLLHTTGTAVALVGALLLLGHATMPVLARR